MATPRATAEGPATEVREAREGLSLVTLIIAAASSATAAIVVSHLWEKGTIAASAMTPVVVAIVSDLLKKPVESERVRSGVRSASSLSRPQSGRTPKVMAPPGRAAPGDDAMRERDDATDAGPVRVYSSGSNKRPWSDSGPRRRLRVKVAVITGLIAFLIAAAALTLPELVFGESVGGGGKTTYFGGGSKDKKGSGDEDESQDGQSDDPSQQDQPDQQDPDAPVVPGEEDGTEDPSGEQPAPAPEEPTEPTPTTPPEAPSQPAPGSTAP